MPGPSLNVARPNQVSVDFPLGHKELDEMIAGYAARYRRHGAELERERRLVEELARAVASDSEAFSAKLTTGNEREPDRSATLKAEENLAASKRRSTALARRLNRDHPVIVKTIEKHGRRLQREARQREREAAERLLEQITGLDFEPLHLARRQLQQFSWWGGDSGDRVLTEEVLMAYDRSGFVEAAAVPRAPFSVESLIELAVSSLAARAAEDEPAEPVVVDAAALEQVEAQPFVPVAIGSASPAELERAARRAG